MSLAPDRPLHGLVLICVGLIALGGCGSFEARPPAGGDDESDAPVVRRGRLQPKLILTGELQAVESAPILVPKTPILQVAIRWMEQGGVSVHQGQRVLELDATQFRETIEQALLTESTARNDLALKEARIELELAQIEFDVRQSQNRLKQARLEASVPEDLRSRRDYRDHQLELARAELSLAKVEEDLRSRKEAATSELEVQRLELRDARQEVETAQQAIKALTLHAPRDGILVVAQHPIDGRRFQVSDTVWVGLEVMSIPTLTRMKVTAHLSDVDDGKIAKGAPVRCTLDAYPDLEFDGRVAEIAPVATEQQQGFARRAFRVEIALDHNDPERMRPGMSVKAEVLPPAVEDVLIAPRWALDLSSDPPRARLASGGTSEVRLGSCNALECVVEDGLSEGVDLRRGG